LAFADADLRAARVLLNDPDVPHRIACFLAQQASEKALKSVLVEESVPFRKTHDLVVLAGLVPAPLATDLESVDLLLLQPWAIDGRYPGDLPDASAAEVVAVVNAASKILMAVERWLTRDA
jgi:HEPN domain-containing protein